MKSEIGNNPVLEPKQESTLTLAEVRAKLQGVKGKRYWRSIDELAGTPEFEAAVAKEFPDQAQEWVDPVSRRGFLKLMGASMALAGLAGCTKQPDEPIYPYVKAPEDLLLGKPNYFATAFPFATGGVPLLVKSDSYRPIKVDGNPDHPYNLGSSDPFTQGTLLDLYDPDRSQHATLRGESREWAEFFEAWRNRLAAGKAAGGEGIYFLSSTITSPTLARQWKEAQALYPKAKLIQYDPVNRDAVHAVLGDKQVQYALDQAEVIVSLDADFLSGASFPGFHKLAREYAMGRKDPAAGMNRLYAVESTTTTTGMKAEHRLGLRASEIPAFAAALAAAVGAGGAAPAYSWTGEQAKFLSALAADLKAHGGKSVVIGGEQQDPSVLAAALAINEALGNTGKTVFFTDAVQPVPSSQTADLKSLVADLNAGKVDWLVMLNVNPLYTTPADLDFKTALGKAKTSVHLGSHVDETGLEATWHLPAAHYLESWSDVRSYDGTVSVVQPLIEPLYNGHSAHAVIQGMLDDPIVSAYEAVRETWKPVLSKGGDFEANWRKALHAGWIDGTAFDKSSSASIAKLPAPAPSAKDTVEVIFRADPTIYDGRFANVGWLQELPKPVTNLSWDNAALMPGTLLTKLGIEEGDILEISAGGRTVKTPVLVVPGHAENSITLYLGYGREAAGRVGSAEGGVGFNAYLVRSSDAPIYLSGATLKRAEGKWGFAVTKSHYQDNRGKAAGGEGNGKYSLEANEAETRGIVRQATLAEFKANPGFANEGEEHPKVEREVTLFPNWEYKDNAWGMSVDMNSCTGCNACIVSCYAENNIAVVGKQQVRIGRNMQWLRIDTYFEGDLSAPKAYFQPMACQHCENAPCEQVCPVGATVHTPEGLNSMVYNRCVGTRYCSNNCPYKVRRFNFLLFSDYETESLKLMRNPDVSVRSRGVMEKCSYCVQRISAAKIDADKENRAIRDGEIVTACQQACPTSAITFGNQNDKTSKVAKLKADERAYSVLADLNTRPRTTYIAAVTNPNPELAEAPEEHAAAKG
jgi:molybdopterin-containing oxidoreductase family iron-sulfur binding subunit